MSMSIAEIYLLLFRASMVPVIGEAVPFPFDGQIELDGWSWNLVNDEEVEARSAIDEKFSDRSSKFDSSIDRTIHKIQVANLPQKEKDRRIQLALRYFKEDLEEQAELDKDESGKKKEDREKHLGSELTFKFSKNVDLATTQLLNSMKAGEVFPRAVLTLHHRSTNTPLTLVVTFAKVRLIEYGLEADVSETMSDMKENWVAEFEEVDYAYKNRSGASGGNGIQQGTARIFKMKLKSLF